MSIESSDAMVIKTVDFSESSLVLTLYTRKFGKIHGIAKGGRRLKNPFESALDLLARINVSFIRKNSDALDLLTEAKLLARFRPTAENLDGLSAGYYLAELLDLMTEDGEPAPEIYDLAARTLDELQTGRRVEERFHRFEWNLLGLTGDQPSLRFCVGCGGEIPLEEMIKRGERVGFGFLDGGVICGECRRTRGFQQVASMAAESLGLIDRLSSDDARSEPAEWNKKSRGEIRGLLNYYFCTLLGRKPKTQDWTT